MRKIFFVLALAALMVFGGAGAAIGSNHQVTICHATGAEGHYSMPNPTKQQIYDDNGHNSGGGVHPGDIIPPFDAGSHGGQDWGAFGGQNWDTEGQAIWNNDCTLPSDNETPVETEKPTETEEPTETEPPVETETPTETEEPVETEEPTETESPVVTETPVETDTPVETEAPAPVETPVQEVPEQETNEPVAVATELPATGVGTYLLLAMGLALTGGGWYTLRRA